MVWIQNQTDEIRHKRCISANDWVNDQGPKLQPGNAICLTFVSGQLVKGGK